MGRTVLPPGERKLRGNAGKRKPRVTIKPAAEPVATRSANEPPAWLTDPIAVSEWHRVLPELLKMRVIATMDHSTLAMYCQNFATWVKAHQAMAGGAVYTTKSKHGEMERLSPHVKLAENAERAMLRYGAQFGLGPLARTKVASGFMANGQQLSLPGFDGEQPQPKQPKPDGPLNAGTEASDPAKEFFGYH